MELEDGYNTPVGGRSYELSGRRKTARRLASLLLKSPRILMLDETTSGLGTRAERLVQAPLETLMKGQRPQGAGPASAYNCREVAGGRSPMGQFFEEFIPGIRYVTPARTVTETDVVMFAAMSGDYNQLHTSETWARDRGPFGRRIAHGLLCLALGHGLMARLGLFDGTAAAFLGLEEWRFQAPVFFGDTLHVEFEVVSARPSRSNPGQGIVTVACEYRNQDGVIVQQGKQILMIRSRPSDAARR
jgi:acyl dehydratase